jgi:hypothetical protein
VYFKEIISLYQYDMLGGVCVGSPMAGIHRYEEQHGLPRNYINVAM